MISPVCHLGCRRAFENQGRTAVGLWLAVEDRVRKGEEDREEKRRKRRWPLTGEQSIIYNIPWGHWGSCKAAAII